MENGMNREDQTLSISIDCFPIPCFVILIRKEDAHYTDISLWGVNEGSHSAFCDRANFSTTTLFIE